MKKMCKYGGICILFVCGFLIFIINKGIDDNSEKEDTSVSVEATTELNSSVEEIIPDTTEEDMTNTDEEEAQKVYYLEDEAVRNEPIFHAFVENEMAAYDLIEKEDKYLIDYYEEYLNRRIFYGVHYMAKDLDNDGEGELLIFLQRSTTDGDVFVFDKVDGRLNAWEIWEDFLLTCLMESQYYEKGMLSTAGSAGQIIGRYNADGRIEYIMKFSRWAEYSDGITLAGRKLVLYKDGIAEKEITYKEAFDTKKRCYLEMTEENQKNKDACDSMLNEIRTELGEGELIRHVEWEEEAEQITLDDLLHILGE